MPCCTRSHRLLLQTTLPSGLPMHRSSGLLCYIYPPRPASSTHTLLLITRHRSREAEGKLSIAFSCLHCNVRTCGSAARTGEERGLCTRFPSMATSMSHRCHMLLLCAVLLAGAVRGHPWGGLFPLFYDHSCPKAKEIVRSVVAQAVARETRMAASLVRLHFHDCFVKGCDASVLLDNSSSIVSEKGSNPNKNSLRGFEVVDQIKAALEAACPGVVSCADILALAARDSTVLVGGPSWDVPLGRRDALGASIQGSNNDIPAPNNTLPTIVTKFRRQGLGVADVVALSGGHTIGMSRCTSFRQRLYNQTGNGVADATLDVSYAAQLRRGCPRSGGDDNLFPLDLATPARFDNLYFKNILARRGLLSSDEVLLTKSAETAALVKAYAANVNLFFQHFSQSMVKMGNISPLTGPQGEIRKNCRRVNSNH